MIELSIIIVNFNTKEFLKKCIDSILRSSFEREYEIIVVDNASDDALTSEISRLRQGLGGQANLKLIQNKENVGFSKANNIGIKEAKGRYFLFLNPDTVLETDTLEHMVSFMEQHQEAGIATCRINLPNGGMDDACHRGFPTPWNALCYFSSLPKLFPKSKFFAGYQMGGLDLSTIHEVQSVCGAFMIVRRQTGDQIGWWDEDYFWYGEDIDFCYRAAQKGWVTYFVPTSSIVHFKGVSGGIQDVSKSITTASKVTKRSAMDARFNAMRIFYKKHYVKKYPFFVTWLIFRSIDVFQFISVLKISLLSVL